jgi:hypothetical protein
MEDVLKGMMDGMSGVKEAKLTPASEPVTNAQLYNTAKCHIQGLLEQSDLTVGQIALLGALVNLVSMNSEW